VTLRDDLHDKIEAQGTSVLSDVRMKKYKTEIVTKLLVTKSFLKWGDPESEVS